MVQTKQSALTI